MSLIGRFGEALGRPNALYLGGKAEAKSRDFLERRNISHILNVTTAKEAGVRVR